MNPEWEKNIRAIMREELRTYYSVIRKDFIGILGWFFAQENWDVDKALRRVVMDESARELGISLLKAQKFKNRLSLLSYALLQRRITGLVLEFGVSEGVSFYHICTEIHDERAYGFDTFQGLPEAWYGQYDAKAFAVKNRPQAPANGEFVEGLFADTLPGFLESHPGQCSFIHIDCDLYKSTSDIFYALENRIVPGTIIVFDEFYNYPEWQKHEFKAFNEFIGRVKYQFKYIGYVPNNLQVAIIITE